MSKLFIFITITMSVKPEASMAGLLASLSENKAIEIIDHDEVTRRVVLRSIPREIGFIELIIERYAGAATYEVKASLKKRFQPKELVSINARYIKQGATLLFFWNNCADGSVFGEVQRSRTLLKYCREALAVDPANVPYSLCSFDPFRDSITHVLEKARRCFEELLLSVGAKE